MTRQVLMDRHDQILVTLPEQLSKSHTGVARWWQSTLNRLPRETMTILGYKMYSWRVMAGLGLLSGMITLPILMRQPGVGLLISDLIIIANLIVFILLIRVSRWLFKGTRIVLLEHVVGALIVTTLVLVWTSSPMLDGLDAWILSTTLGLAIGRVGCLLGGCCHGRPSAVGICYSWRMWRQIPQEFNRVRLIPVQCYEFLLLVAIFIIGFILFLLPHHSGDILVLFMTLYGAGRFGLEFLRGDSRPYWQGLSEPQWTSLGLICLVIGTSILIPGLPIIRWVMWSGMALVAAVVLSILGRHRSGPPLLRPLHPWDIIELIHIIKRIRADALGIVPDAGSIYAEGRTSHGLLIRLRASLRNGHINQLYQFSSSNSRLDEGTAALVALVIGYVYGVNQRARGFSVDAHRQYSLTFTSSVKNSGLTVTTETEASRVENAPTLGPS